MRDVRQRAWLRWQAAAGPWVGWCVCPLLAAPDADGVDARASHRPADTSLADDLRQTISPGGVLVLLDLQPEHGIHIGVSLNAQRLAHVVLVLPRWPYRQAILPADRLLHVLLSHSTHLRADVELANVVFVLDADRVRCVPRRRAMDPRADNRYQLSPIDLPDLAALRSRGIQRILKVART